MATTHEEFWRSQGGLVWSNPQADDAVHIRAALLRPRFTRLLNIAVKFGLERLYQEWAVLQGDASINTKRVRDAVERILSNIEKGFADASSAN